MFYNNTISKWVKHMLDFLKNLDVILENALNSLGVFGPILGCFLILVESIMPVLPLALFITLNFYAFGHFFGFIISYALTVIGCNLAFILSRKILKNRMDYLIKKYDKNKILKWIDKFSNIKFTNLVLLMAFPFTPAFVVNYISGITQMDQKKFLLASIIGKPFMVYFWGYIGVTLIESLKEPILFLKVLIIMAIAYIVSTIVNKKVGLD